MPRYFSTRSSKNVLSFEEAVIEGLAPDGGLYIPDQVPHITSETLKKWQSLDFVELAVEILSLYIPESEIPRKDLESLARKSYSNFRSKEVTPTRLLNKEKSLYLLELFHGPTYAFKDVGLQFVGNLFEYFLVRRNQGKAEDSPDREKITVVGATSGDTGSAAIYGLRNKKDVSVFILYPTGRISPIQEMQMTTVLDKNVHTISVKGTFDDCQDLVKQVFGDKEFNSKYHVGAVNSINLARILGQTVYYFYSYFSLVKSGVHPKVKFVVPTGNFGDILAGFYAQKMGLPIESLVVATNANDILHRFFQSGDYNKSSDGKPPHVQATLSPAMDVLVSSNFERFLWYLARENLAESNEEAGMIVNQWMSDLKTSGHFHVPEDILAAARKYFGSERASDEDTVDTIKSVYEKISPKYILDPHSAVAVTGALRIIEKDQDPSNQYVALSTAHPAKFAEAVDLALKGIPGYSFENDVLPEQFKEMATKESKKLFAEDTNLDTLKNIIIEQLSKE
jgi:threonine synthase